MKIGEMKAVIIDISRVLVMSVFFLSVRRNTRHSVE